MQKEWWISKQRSGNLVRWKNSRNRRQRSTRFLLLVSAKTCLQKRGKPLVKNSQSACAQSVSHQRVIATHAHPRSMRFHYRHTQKDEYKNSASPVTLKRKRTRKIAILHKRVSNAKLPTFSTHAGESRQKTSASLGNDSRELALKRSMHIDIVLRN